MATSGSRDFDIDVGEIIEESYERCGLEVRTGYDANVDLPLTKISRGDYLNLTNKTTSGRPTQYFFDRQITPVLTLWPTPNDSTETLVYYFVNRIQDADTLQNTTDAPFRFLPCMVAGLSYYIALKKAPERVQLLKTVYEEEFQRAADEDEDRISLKLQPSISYLRV